MTNWPHMTLTHTQHTYDTRTCDRPRKIVSRRLGAREKKNEIQVISWVIHCNDNEKQRVQLLKRLM